MSLLFAYHYRCLEVDVKDDEQFVITRLEEEVFDIAKEKICENDQS